MRVCLIQPHAVAEKHYLDFTIRGLTEHIGLEYLGASLIDAGFEVTLIDAASMELNNAAVLSQLVLLRPTLVGLTLENHSLSDSMVLARMIKDSLPDCHIVVGGHLATNAPLEILSDNECCDSVVVGFGEETIVCLASVLESGAPLHSVNGLVYKTENSMVVNSPRQITVPIDEMSLPNRVLLNWRKENGYPPAARMITSRGCPHICKMCTTPPFLQTQRCSSWMARSPEDVVSEAAKLVQDHGIKTIVFCDDNFIGPGESGRRRAKRIARLLIDLRLPLHFWIMCRIDGLMDQEKELLPLLREAGLFGIVLGVESGSPSSLEIYGKDIDLDYAARTVSRLRLDGVFVELGFINFHPWVTWSQLEENASFLNTVGEASTFHYFASTLALYPGITLIDSARQDGLLPRNYDYKVTGGYTFQERSIGSFFNHVRFIALELRDADECIWHLKRLETILTLVLKQAKVQHAGCGNIALAHTEIRQELNSISTLNYKKFMCYMNLSKEKATISSWKRATSEHQSLLRESLIRLHEAVMTIERSWTETLSQCPSGEFVSMFFRSTARFQLESLVDSASFAASTEEQPGVGVERDLECLPRLS